MGRKRATVVVEANEDKLEGVFDKLEEAPVVAAERPPSERSERIPDIGSEDWTNFILDKLRPDELPDGCPTYEGLRRLCYDYLGDIVDVSAHVVQAPNLDNGNHSCVQVGLTIRHPEDFVWLGRIAGMTISYEHVGDVFMGNGPDKFAWRFSSSTCTTRTKAALLRDVFRLRKVYAKEELSAEPAESSDDRVTATQVAGVDVLCRKLKVNASRFLIGWWKHQRPGEASEDLNKLPFGVVAGAFKKLNKWMQKRDEIPAELVGSYDSKWTESIKCFK